MTWSVQKRRIFLEHLDAEVTVPQASPTLYWGRMGPEASDKPTTIRIRPQTPVP